MPNKPSKVPFRLALGGIACVTAWATATVGTGFLSAEQQVQSSTQRFLYNKSDVMLLCQIKCKKSGPCEERQNVPSTGGRVWHVSTAWSGFHRKSLEHLACPLQPPSSPAFRPRRRFSELKKTLQFQKKQTDGSRQTNDVGMEAPSKLNEKPDHVEHARCCLNHKA